MKGAFRNIWIVYKRELKSHFNTMLAYVFIVIFVALVMALMFLIADFFNPNRQDAALAGPFFSWHPWLFIILAPAVGMRLWSDEHRTGTIELLLTMPIAPWHAIMGKYLAALSVIAFALLGTFPAVITVAYLGDPDNGAIWAGYIASLLLAAGCLAITCAVSAFTRSLISSLVVSVALCFVLILIGSTPATVFITDVVSGGFAEFIASFSMMSHFEDMVRGVISLNNFVFYVSLIGFCLFLTSTIINTKRT